MTQARQGSAPDRILLVGFMASGKSTVGRRLAALLDWEFIDFDEEIERRVGLPIPEIFRRHGEGYFREWEAVLTREVADLDALVLAPGGGWITQPELMRLLARGTWVVWLKVSPEEAVRRARRTLSHRPLLSGPQPLDRARELLADREPLYEAVADVAIDVNGRDSDDVAREILRRLHEEAATGSRGSPD